MSEDTEYDVVIVGAGASGAMCANALSREGLKVLVLEAGPAMRHPEDHVETFYRADTKSPDSPWPATPDAPRPKVTDMAIRDTFRDRKYYMQQTGKIPFNSTYERLGGGTSNHWLGTCLRHVPNDFKLKSTYDKGEQGQDGPLLQYARDWPLTYDELEPWYYRAELEAGVSGNSEEYDGYLGAKRSHPYPMDEIPLSYSDQRLAARLNGYAVEGVKIAVMSTPQGRNSREYPTVDDARRHKLGGVDTGPAQPVQRFLRYRCLGNSSCIPVCPIQAKWDATTHLARATEAYEDESYPNRVPAEVRYKSVVYRVVVGDDDQVEQLSYKDYSDANAVQDRSVRAKVYVLAGHAIETPKLLLMSPWAKGGKTKTVANTSDQVGRNLMDHVIHLSWGLADEPLYPFRGPLSTTGIGEFRDGAFRSSRAAYRIEVGNDGWVWPAGAPQKTVWQVMNLDNPATQDDPGIGIINKFYKRPKTPDAPRKWYGKELRRAVGEVVTHQVRMAVEPEALPLPTSNVTVPQNPSSDQVDHLGLPKPQVHYDVSEYTKRGFAHGQEALQKIFERLGVDEIATTLVGLKLAAAQFHYDGKDYEYGGAGHIAGTYRMGTDETDSVVDADCRAHDHRNLFMLGSGVFPALGTANPTLTIMALALRAADTIVAELRA